MSGRPRKVDPERVRALRAAGLTYRQIAAQLRISTSSVQYWLASDQRRATWGGRKKSSRSRVEVTVDFQVRALAMYGLYVGARWSLERIGRRYKVSRQQVWNLISRLSPPHLRNEDKPRETKQADYEMRRQWALALREVASPQELRRAFDLPPGTRLFEHGKRLWFPVWGWSKGDRIIALWNAGFTMRTIARHLRIEHYDKGGLSYIGSMLCKARSVGIEVRRAYSGGRDRPHGSKADAGWGVDPAPAEAGAST